MGEKTRTETHYVLSPHDNKLGSDTVGLVFFALLTFLLLLILARSNRRNQAIAESLIQRDQT